MRVHARVSCSVPNNTPPSPASLPELCCWRSSPKLDPGRLRTGGRDGQIGLERASSRKEKEQKTKRRRKEIGRWNDGRRKTTKTMRTDGVLSARDGREENVAPARTLCPSPLPGSAHSSATCTAGGSCRQQIQHAVDWAKRRTRKVWPLRARIGDCKPHQEHWFHFSSLFCFLHSGITRSGSAVFRQPFWVELWIEACDGKRRMRRWKVLARFICEKVLARRRPHCNCWPRAGHSYTTSLLLSHRNSLSFWWKWQLLILGEPILEATLLMRWYPATLTASLN